MKNCIIIVDEAHNLPDRIRMSMERVITPIIIRNAAMELEEYMGTLENSAMKNSSASTMQSLEEVQWSFEVVKLLRVKLGDYFRFLHSQVADDDEIIVSAQEFSEKVHQACDEFEGLVGQMKLDHAVEIQPLIQKSQRMLRLSEILAKVVIDTESEEEASEPDSHRISYILSLIHI